MTAVFNAIAHFLVDAVCVSAVLGFGAEGMQLSNAVVLYNTLAFSTQCLVGLLLDRINSKRVAGSAGSVRRSGLLASLGMMLVAAGAMTGLISSRSSGMLFAMVVAVGLGNSLFHVAGGIVTLEKSGGKAAPLGVFVAPGAFGVTLGTLYPKIAAAAATALAVFAVIGALMYSGRVFAGALLDDEGRSGAVIGNGDPGFPMAPAVLLTAAVAVRAIGGSAAVFSWKQGAFDALLLTLFVFLGKSLGGFMCDRIGAEKSALASILPAAVLTAFFAGNMALSLAGQLLINLTMPVTLWLLYRLMPKEPGLAFGLAASALWPGTIIGMLIKLTGPAQAALIIISFLFGAGAVIYSERYLRRGK